MKFAIVNSRVSKVILGADPWVKSTKKAFDEITQVSDCNILTSIELYTWEMVLFLASKKNCRVTVYVPENAKKSEVIEEFMLDEDAVDFVYVEGDYKGKNWWHKRDKAIINDADKIYAIWVREGGNIERNISELKAEDKIVETYKVSNPIDETISQRYPKTLKLSELSDKVLNDSDWNYLTHWTHTSYAPWCFESKFEFYKSIINSHDVYSHNAFNSLKRILERKIICGSSKGAREGKRFVSFTALSPLGSLRFMRWRKGLGRFYWEPYGLAITIESAFQVGLRPVNYVAKKDYDKLPETLKDFYQPLRSRRYVWAYEQEWRLPGDLDLSLVPKESMLAIVRNKEESEELRKEFGIKTLALTED